MIKTYKEMYGNGKSVIQGVEASSVQEQKEEGSLIL